MSLSRVLTAVALVLLAFSYVVEYPANAVLAGVAVVVLVASMVVLVAT